MSRVDGNDAMVSGHLFPDLMRFFFKFKFCFGPTSFPGLFPLKLGGAGKDPGIGWSRDSKHPKILGVINYDVMNV